jgi:predicted O-methyltransferase YrrM
MMRRLRRLVSARRRKAADRRIRKALAGTADPSYTTDYISDFVQDWTRVLAPIAGRPGVRMLEIGSFEGRSASWFLQNVLTDESARLVCIDLFSRPGLEARFDHNVGLADRHGQVRKLKGMSADVLATLEPASFDVIYVDGGHDAATVLLDGLLAWRLLKSGGTLIFDDYLWEPQRPASGRPQLAIDLFREALADEMESLHAGYQVIVRKREHPHKS